MGAVMRFCVYILYSRERNKYYIGQTGDMEQRAKWHLDGKTFSTRGVRGWEILFLQTVAGRTEAMKLESAIKKTKSRRSVNRYIADERNEMKQAMSLIEFFSGCSALSRRSPSVDGRRQEAW